MTTETKLSEISWHISIFKVELADEEFASTKGPDVLDEQDLDVLATNLSRKPGL